MRPGRVEAEDVVGALAKLVPLLAIAGLYEVRLEENGVALPARRVTVCAKKAGSVA